MRKQLIVTLFCALASSSLRCSELAVKPNAPPAGNAANGALAANGAEFLCREGKACVTPPSLISGESPSYPEVALRAGISGSAAVVFSIDVDGQVTDARVESSTSPDFAAAALQAVNSWKFKPATFNGKPTKTLPAAQTFAFSPGGLENVNSGAQDIVRPFEMAAQEYYQALLHRRYADLERLAEESRRQNTTISDGQPRLAAIYGGLAGCLTEGCTDRLTEAEWQHRLQLLTAWRQNDPASVTAEVAHARLYVEHAYAIRGQGYADTVKAENWPIFAKGMDSAYSLLQAASPAAKLDPGWFDAMLNIGVAQAWPEKKFNEVFREGKRIAPSYLPIYFSASSYFAPRWHGSTSDLRRFIEDAVVSTRPQLGETMYARLNWSLWTESMFTDGQADWGRMKAGFERITSDFPDSWNINNYAKFACLANDPDTLLSLAKKIGDHPIEAAWWDSADAYKKCVAVARSSTKISD